MLLTNSHIAQYRDLEGPRGDGGRSVFVNQKNSAKPFSKKGTVRRFRIEMSQYANLTKEILRAKLKLFRLVLSIFKI